MPLSPDLHERLKRGVEEAKRHSAVASAKPTRASILDIPSESLLGLDVPEAVAVAWAGWRVVWSVHYGWTDPYPVTIVVLSRPVEGFEDLTGWAVTPVWTCQPHEGGEPTGWEDQDAVTRQYLLARLLYQTVICPDLAGLMMEVRRLAILGEDNPDSGDHYADMEAVLEGLPDSVEPTASAMRMLAALSPA